MSITAGIDVGSGAVKAVVMDVPERGEAKLLGQAVSRIRKREVAAVVDEVFADAASRSGADHIDYIATTGEGEDVPFATGHFYGMTTHARGALWLDPRARAVLDVGALHARAVAMDDHGRVLDYKMTSQCASGSGQFLENIARYLGVQLSDVGALSLEARKPEKVSSICAVLAETDVINMVSRGISTSDILRGIHDSMGGRFARLLTSMKVTGVVMVSGGLAGDVGLLRAIEDVLGEKGGLKVELVAHPQSIHAGSIGAALWGAYRNARIGRTEIAWNAEKKTSSIAPTP